MNTYWKVYLDFILYNKWIFFIHEKRDSRKLTVVTFTAI